MQRRVTRPLHLGSTYLANSPRFRGSYAHGYAPPGIFGDGYTDTSPWTPTWAWAAGALVSTTTDLATFYQALLSGRLLPRALLREMTTTVSPFPGAGTAWASSRSTHPVAPSGVTPAVSPATSPSRTTTARARAAPLSCCPPSPTTPSPRRSTRSSCWPSARCSASLFGRCHHGIPWPGGLDPVLAALNWSRAARLRRERRRGRADRHRRCCALNVDPSQGQPLQVTTTCEVAAMAELNRARSPRGCPAPRRSCWRHDGGTAPGSERR